MVGEGDGEERNGGDGIGERGCWRGSILHSMILEGSYCPPLS